MPDIDTNIAPGLGLSDATGGIAALSRAASLFLSGTGTKIGKIQGNSTVKGQIGSVLALGFHWEITSPRDVYQGMSTGRRVHHPLHIAFKLDKSAPQWFNAIATNDTFKTVELDVWSGISKASGIAAGSGYKKVYTIELKNANIERYKQFTAVNGELCLTVAFTYQSVTVTWVDGGISGMDDWLSGAQP
jgi:type VI secretion system Hcp family effector